jgi:hypothetical protein
MPETGMSSVLPVPGGGSAGSNPAGGANVSAGQGAFLETIIGSRASFVPVIGLNTARETTTPSSSTKSPDCYHPYPEAPCGSSTL